MRDHKQKLQDSKAGGASSWEEDFVRGYGHHSVMEVEVCKVLLVLHDVGKDQQYSLEELVHMIFDLKHSCYVRTMQIWFKVPV